jgi:hypothetical protein
VNVCNLDMNNWEYNVLECLLSRDLNFIFIWEINFIKIIYGKKDINEITYNQPILYVHHKTYHQKGDPRKNIHYIMPHVMKNEEQTDKFPCILNLSTRSQ